MIVILGTTAIVNGGILHSEVSIYYNKVDDEEERDDVVVSNMVKKIMGLCVQNLRKKMKNLFKEIAMIQKKSPEMKKSD